MKRVLSLLASLATTVFAADAEPNPPTWSPNVKYFSPQGDFAAYNKTLDAIHTEMGGRGPGNAVPGQFSSSRYALLFAPGNYDELKIEVGFYTQVLGLGRIPQEVQFADFGTTDGSNSTNPGSLQTFWRSAENFYAKPPSGKMVWAVSQASPIRRMVVDGDLDLFFDGEYSSGGFMADSFINGELNTGSQQQWMFRNNHFEQYKQIGGGWNFVFVGNDNAPAQNCNGGWGAHYTTADATPRIAEKPYIAQSTSDHTKFDLIVPAMEWNSQGQSYHQFETVIPFEQVFVATETNTAAEINAKIDSGLHLVLQPGIYNLTESIVVKNENTTVLGLGMATLVATSTVPCILVKNVDGVRIGGILFQAGENNSTSLLQWGEQNPKDYLGNAMNPGLAYDLFTRVGGPLDPKVVNMTTQSQVIIYSGNVIIDNAWLWRADHYVNSQSPVMYGENYSENGIQVWGKNVTAYGVAAEHSLGDQVVWNGNGGESWFFQSELPYGVDQTDYADKGFVGYRVGDHVTSHSANGVGAYTYFRDYKVTVANGFSAPDHPGVVFNNAFTLFLFCGPDATTEKCGTSISNVINNIGGPIELGDNNHKYVCKYENGKFTLPASTSSQEQFLQ